eukprot:533343-Amphidinium_carterae.2
MSDKRQFLWYSSIFEGLSSAMCVFWTGSLWNQKFAACHVRSPATKHSEQSPINLRQVQRSEERTVPLRLKTTMPVWSDWRSTIPD